MGQHDRYGFEGRAWAAGQARNPELSLWLRIVYAARCRCRPDGGARFAKGELAELLGRIDTETGEVLPNKNVTRELAKAKKYGFIAEDSTQELIWLDGASYGVGAGAGRDMPPPAPEDLALMRERHARARGA